MLLLLGACTSSAPSPSGGTFPEGFRWGSATAGFQVEMGCPTWPEAECTDRASDWYQWVTDPSIVEDEQLYVSGEPVTNGPGMWETFEDDVARMKADGHSAFRMSIEWSRLFPDGAAEAATTVDDLQDHVDRDALARYHEMLGALHAANVLPVVTINHYVLPLWVHDGVACHVDLAGCAASGWMDGERTSRLISLYAGFLAREFGDEVDVWFTLNEPFATTVAGYMLPSEDRSAPPGLYSEVEATRDVTFHQVEASAAMYDAVKAEDPVATVGVVINMVAITPRDPANEYDVQGVANMDWLYHRLFLEALVDGSWDSDLDGDIDTTRPELAGRLDAIGVNYYNEVEVAGLSFSLYPEIPTFTFNPVFTWLPHEEGLGEVVREAGEYGLPVWVTENGTPYVEDQGEEVLENHLRSLKGAIDDGTDVRGYLYWSWVDNYEWNHGLNMKFGLYGLDPETKARIERPVAGRYREILRDNGL